jgi:hypothetical protein
MTHNQAKFHVGEAVRSIQLAVGNIQEEIDLKGERTCRGKAYFFPIQS